jgi:hypothetical protein
MTENHDDRDLAPHPKPDEKISPAGPHDKPDLTDPHKTPGSGVLPESDSPEVEGPTG